LVDITLSDYVGCLFAEAVKAREMADIYSLEVAGRRKDHPLLGELGTPRFTIARLEMVIPVLVTDAKVTQTARFAMDAEDFLRVVLVRAGQSLNLLAQANRSLSGGDVTPLPDPTPDSAAEREALVLHKQLVGNPDPLRPAGIVRTGWFRVLAAAVRDQDSLREHADGDEARRILAESTQSVLDLVRSRTVLDRAAVEQVLVNPLTHAVGTESDGRSVFTIRVELVEERFRLQEVRDPATDKSHTIVDFE